MTYKPYVFDLNQDDMFPALGQILVTVWDSGNVEIAYRPSRWDSWWAPLKPIITAE